ncbi:hypothetical protein DN752_20985 [Echinicola strongylocentroti]|uniref:Uncharacterized protein n=1 Tax=Echinicola strongylocentroti TaxID=1795355 RepID=A0A2Z4IP64_9BACT|nr:hypothetical protein [Echinicola strongylocentroti]AWW32418.1 hypothetical protein DN752_20985 [Echinicola strongylocentroti]
MKNPCVKIELQVVEDIRELMKQDWQNNLVRNVGLLYFQLLEGGGFVTKAVNHTDSGDWMKKMVKQKRIYLPKQAIYVEEEH